MTKKNKQSEVPKPAQQGTATKIDTEEPLLFTEDNPDTIPEEDPFENPPPFENPEPGEGP